MTHPHRLGQVLGTYATAVGIGGVAEPVLAAPLLAASPAPLLGTCAAVAIGAALIPGTNR